MPVTQYIGARYVPLIYQNPDDNSNTWKSGVAYDPLTIVSWAGGSYTSKSAVPAGASNPADAPEYWVSIGLYSGQTSINTNNIDHIQHALANATEAGYTCTTARAEGDLVWIDGILYECTAAVNVNDSYTEGINITQELDVIKTIIDALSQMASDISDCGGDIFNLQGDVTQLQNDVLALQADTDDPFTIMLGDSYATGWTPDGDNSGWPTYLENLGVSRNIKLSDGGVAFGRAESDPKAPISLLQNATLPTGVTANDVKRIIVLLGYNDFYQADADIVAHIRSFVTYCNTTYQNAVVYIGMCGYCDSRDTNGKFGVDVVRTARSYANALRTTNAVFVPQVLGILFANGSLASDGIHPLESGNKLLALAMWNALHGSSFTAHAYYEMSAASTAYATVSGKIKLDASVNNGILTGIASSNLELTDSAPHDLHNIPLTASGTVPSLPFGSFHIFNLWQTYDKSNGLGKDFYSSFVTAEGFGYNLSSRLEFNSIADSGGAYGKSSHVKSIDNFSYQISASFI